MLDHGDCIITKNDLFSREEIHGFGSELVIHRSQNVQPIIDHVENRREHAKGKDMWYLGSMPNIDYWRLKRAAGDDEDKFQRLVEQYFQANTKFSTGLS